MNLYERLKTEHKQKLNANLDPYPTTKEQLINDLKSKNYVIHLTYGTLVELYQALDLNVIQMMPYELFEDNN